MSEATQSPQILIVDDNINLFKTLAFILKRKGYEVTMAASGAEALELVQSHGFDMIFMDIKMPLMNGVEAYKRIKQIRPESVVMMMTAYAVEDLVQEALAEGAYGILHKPFDIEKVIGLIEDIHEQGEGGFIMVADDDTISCDVLKDLLTRHGHRVGIAHSSEEALALAEQGHYNLLFVDVELPTLNGLETYLRIRKRNPEIITVVMADDPDDVPELVEMALRNSAYTCLYKPIDLDGTLQLVEQILQRRSPADLQGG